MKESKTIKQFKSDLIRTMPYFPNTKEVKEDLHSQDLCSVLFHYLHWASRLIPTRPRKVTFEPYLFYDTRCSEYESDVFKLCQKAKLGEDLTGHLSNQVLTKGYSPQENILAVNDAWVDKDQLLNTKGFHHFHLKSGRANKSNIVLLARVSREEFKAIALFDHSVFDYSKGSMSQERRRMWSIYEHMISRELPPDSVYMSHPITTSGHPIHILAMNQQYWHVIEQCDDKLSSREFVQKIYSETEYDVPKKTKFRWFIDGLDLGLLETKSNRFFIIRRGYL